ncbi:MAG TPA: enolase C-terminal domain-like protein, partial [Thermomicrobiales bacterium]|nr:enolase C-terminal domain-like protein [Thermomicrobiales bacterium]
GEVSCTPLWSGEDQVSAAHFIDRLLAPLLIGEHPLDRGRLVIRMNRALANNPFTKAGIEIALWDIAGKAAGLPVHALLGGAVRDTVRTKYSVSGLEPPKAAALAVWAVEQGFTAMKVKVGIEPAVDIERVRQVRAAVGPDILLGVDANGGWSPAEAVQVLPALEAEGIAFVEQPVPEGDVRWLARVRSRTTMPIVADESISTAQDALDLIAHEAADVFSIYVGMGGGIAEGAAVATVAQAAKLACTIGSNLELGIAQAAMIHLALAHPGIRPEVVPCDIISRFFYAGDIVQEPLPVEAGVAHRIDKPGLGVEIDRDAMARYRVS